MSDVKPGVCNYCGYCVRPNSDEVAVVGSWDFAHERCVPADDREVTA